MDGAPDAVLAFEDGAGDVGGGDDAEELAWSGWFWAVEELAGEPAFASVGSIHPDFTALASPPRSYRENAAEPERNAENPRDGLTGEVWDEVVSFFSGIGTALHNDGQFWVFGNTFSSGGVKSLCSPDVEGLTLRT